MPRMGNLVSRLTSVTLHDHIPSFSPSDHAIPRSRPTLYAALFAIRQFGGQRCNKLAMRFTVVRGFLFCTTLYIRSLCVCVIS